jgi:hypothetical protein
MVEELFGLPGSGKSYYAQHNKKGFFYYRRFSETFFGKAFYYVNSRALILINKKTRRYYKLLKAFLINKGIIFDKANRELILTLLFEEKLYCRNFLNFNIMMDEGIVQAAASLSYKCFHGNDFVDYFFDVVSLSKYKIKFKFISTDVKTSLENIHIRNRKVCDLDFLDDKELLGLLIKEYEIYNYCFILLKKMGLIVEVV